MSFKWSQYVDLAEKLIEYAKNDSTLELAYYRSAISRSYYGVLCIAIEKVQKAGYDQVTFYLFWQALKRFKKNKKFTFHFSLYQKWIE
jgi:hypothetical protein